MEKSNNKQTFHLLANRNKHQKLQNSFPDVNVSRCGSQHCVETVTRPPEYRENVILWQSEQNLGFWFLAHFFTLIFMIKPTLECHRILIQPNVHILGGSVRAAFIPWWLYNTYNTSSLPLTIRHLACHSKHVHVACSRV